MVVIPILSTRVPLFQGLQITHHPQVCLPRGSKALKTTTAVAASSNATFHHQMAFTAASTRWQQVGLTHWGLDKWPPFCRWHVRCIFFDGLMQERCNSSALAMELRLSCSNPSIYALNKISLKYVFKSQLGNMSTLICSGNGSVPSGIKAITWSNVVQVP